MRSSLLCCCLGFLAAPIVAQPVQRRGVPEVKDAMRNCRHLLPLPQVLEAARAKMGDARWIGADLDIVSCVYTLKFLREGAVIWVEMDGQSARYLGSTGN